MCKYAFVYLRREFQSLLTTTAVICLFDRYNLQSIPDKSTELRSHDRNCVCMMI